MPISYPAILHLRTEALPIAWSDKDAMLYALGVGMGADPLNEAELPFVYENGLKAVPTLCTVPAFGAGPLGKSGINFMMVVHGDQACEFHKPFPPEGQGTADSRIVEAFDRGPGRGALLIVETVLNDDKGEKLVTLTSGVMARGDGGFGGPSTGMPEAHKTPDRAPDMTLELPTRHDQALLYRLSGDRNPLHADPAFAKAVGFPRPILHGLCTYGIACRAVMKAYASNDPARILSHSARFSAPVFPGETLTFDLWRDGNEVSFEARVAERDVKVLKHGHAGLAA
ncbi:MAG: MaoC/PaaZ C-terminal domain-containing protein [Caulobacteraceae bacterium]